MLWIIIGIVGGTLFVGLSVFLLNPPESLLKTVIDKEDEEDPEDDQLSSEQPTETDKS